VSSRANHPRIVMRIAKQTSSNQVSIRSLWLRMDMSRKIVPIWNNPNRYARRAESELCYGAV
jgi:hypothetical protein